MGAPVPLQHPGASLDQGVGFGRRPFGLRLVPHFGD